MIPNDLEETKKDDIDALLVDAVSELRKIDYKLLLPGGADAERKDFLADVCSFANAAGGHLVYGVREKDGCPTAIPGLPEINADKVILRLAEMILKGIEPRVPNVRFHAVDGFPEGPVIVLRVPKSWAAPHMVSFKQSSRFYTRDSNGKHQLDVQEIRHAFSMLENIPNRIRQFREDRLARIVAGETPFPLPENPKVVLHLIPAVGLDPTYRVDLATLASNQNREVFVPMRDQGGCDHRFNFDGYAGYWPLKSESPKYVQAFRNGTLESVEAFVLAADQRAAGLPRGVVRPTVIEPMIVEAIEGYLKCYVALDVGPPIFVLLTLLGVKDSALNVVVASGYGKKNRTLDRDDLLLPDVVVQDFKDDVAKVLRPTFDVLHQAYGEPRDPNYGPDGEWRLRLKGSH